jgi:hypothetical protein
MNPSAWGDPNYFVLLDHILIDAKLFSAQLPSSRDLYIIEFQAAGLEVPTSEPLCVYHYAGIRRFIWRDKVFSEYQLAVYPLIERAAILITETADRDMMLKYRRLLDMLKGYRRAPAPNYNLSLIHI